MPEPLPPLPPLPAPEARLPLRKSRRSGGWFSLVIHLILLLVLVEATRNNVWWNPPDSDTRQDRIGGGGGGRQVDMIALPDASRTPEPVKVVPPPPPVPVPVVTPVPVPPPVPTPPIDTIPKATGGATNTGSEGGSGGGSGTGKGPGSGPGTGPGSGGPGPAPDSTRTAARDPEPRQLILIPFDYPPSMRGRTIQVTFFVLADGQVDHVLFSEDIPDRGYAKRLETVMRAYRFRPARSAAGQPVPGHTIVSVTF